MNIVPFIKPSGAFCYTSALQPTISHNNRGGGKAPPCPDFPIYPKQSKEVLHIFYQIFAAFEISTIRRAVNIKNSYAVIDGAPWHHLLIKSSLHYVVRKETVKTCDDV